MARKKKKEEITQEALPPKKQEPVVSVDTTKEEKVKSSDVPVPKEFSMIKVNPASRGNYQIGNRIVSPQEYKSYLESQKIITEGGKKAITPQEVQAQDQQEQALIQQQTEENPERRQLNPPDAGFIQKLPVIGGISTTLARVITNPLEERRKRREAEGKSTVDENFFFSEEGKAEPEILRNAALTEIEAKVYEEGLTASEKFGMLIEGIPIVGALLGKYGGGLIETPRGNIEEMRKTIKKEKTRMTKYETWARNGVINRQTAMDRANEMGAELQRLESRLKLLIIYSPTLQYNSDEINTIETEILTNKEILVEIKGRIIMMPDNIQPSDWDIYFALEDLDNEEE